jgi:hypothetical protein
VDIQYRDGEEEARYHARHEKRHTTQSNHNSTIKDWKTMTIKEDPNDHKKEGYEEDVVVTAVPASPQGNEPPIPDGHARFYCNKCHTVSLSCYIYLCRFLESELVMHSLVYISQLLTFFNSTIHISAVALRPSESSNIVEMHAMHGI